MDAEPIEIGPARKKKKRTKRKAGDIDPNGGGGNHSGGVNGGSGTQSNKNKTTGSTNAPNEERKVSKKIKKRKVCVFGYHQSCFDLIVGFQIPTLCHTQPDSCPCSLLGQREETPNRAWLLADAVSSSPCVSVWSPWSFSIHTCCLEPFSSHCSRSFECRRSSLFGALG